MLSRQFKPQPSVQMNNYGIAQEQPIVTSQSSWSPPSTQNQQYGQSFNQQPQSSFVPQETQSSFVPQQTQSSFVPQQTQSSFVPQQTQSSFIPQQPMRAFNRVFQPEPTRILDQQSTSSGYRR